MCGRFALTVKTKNVEKLVPGLQVKTDLQPRYNIAPSQKIAAVLNTSPNDITMLRWGLVPSWAKTDAHGSNLINARSETLTEKPSFRNAFRKRRCLIFADGWYEWQSVKGSNVKQPFFIKLVNNEPFTFAGLWEKWISPNNEELLTATIITTTPNPLLATIHNRMPCIIGKEDRSKWLSGMDISLEQLLQCLRSYPENEITFYPVSLAVNNPSMDLQECIKPV
jgi:putative SOS response-associated peptidase YedK